MLKKFLVVFFIFILCNSVFGQKVSISVQPVDQTTCEGGKVTFSVSSNAASFQWMESKDGINFSVLNEDYIYSGTKTKELTLKVVNSIYDNYAYKCVLKDITGTDSVSTDVSKIRINAKGTPLSETFDVCQGTNVDLIATSSLLANHQYEWITPNGVVKPGNVNSFNTSVPGTYTVNVFAPNNLLCNSDFETYSSTGVFINNNIATNCWGTTATDNKIEVWTSSLSVPSYSGTKFIEINATEAASIYQDFSGIIGAQLAISFAHRGRVGVDVMRVEIGPPTGPFVSLGNYSDDKTAWGYYTTIYTIPATGKYRLKFTAVSSSGPDNTWGNFLDAIFIKTLTCASVSKEFIVNEIPLPIAQIAGADTVCKNDASPTLTFTGSNGIAPYIFTYSINGGTNKTITSTGNIATLAIPTTTVGESVYKLISVKEGSPLTCSQALSSTQTYKILPNSVGGTLTASQTICSGTTPSALSLSGHVGTITKWQSCEPPSTSWTDITNTTSSYTPSALTKTTKFRVEVKNDICTPVYSNEITITVDEATVGGTISSDQNICEIATPALLALTGHKGQIKKWQFSADPYNSWSDLTNTSTTFSPPKLTKSTKYRAVIKNGVCPEAYAAATTITIKPIEKLNITCGLSSTTSVEFTWTDISDETTYDYTYSIDGGPDVVGKALINTTSVTIPVTGDGQTVELKNLTATGASCAQAESKICISKTCPTPLTNPILDLNVCSGGTISIPPFTSPNTPTSYKWRVNYSGFSIGSSGTQNVPYAAATNSMPPSFTAPTTTSQIVATFSVNAIDGTCTGPTMNFKVIVNPLPVLNITNDGPICSGERAIQLAENSGNAISWKWSTSSTTNLSSKTISNPTISNLKNSEVVIVEATDVNSCKNTATTTLVVHALPNIDAGSDQTICRGSSILLSGSGGTSYTWDNSVTDGISFLLNTTKTFTVIGTDKNGCKKSDQVTIRVNPLPDFTLSVNEPCVNADLIFKADLAINPSTAGIQTAAWKGPNSYSAYGNRTSITIPTVSLADTGMYYFSLTDNNNCVTVKSIKAKINPIQSNLSMVTSSGINSFCMGDSLKLIAQGATNYLWNTGKTANFITVKAPGKYTVSTNDALCSSSVSLEVKVDTLRLNISVPSMVLLSNGLVSLIGNPKEGKFTGIGIKTNSFDPKVAGLGIKKITFTYISPTNCKAQLAQNILVYDTLNSNCTVTKYDTVVVKNNIYDTITVKNNVYDTVTITNKVTQYDTVIVKNTIYDTILKLKFKLTTGLQANKMASISLYPNPTSDVLHIEVGDAKALDGYRYRIVDALGKEVYNELVKSAITGIPMKTLGAAGMYQFEVLDQKNVRIQTNKIVLQ